MSYRKEPAFAAAAGAIAGPRLPVCDNPQKYEAIFIHLV